MKDEKKDEKKAVSAILKHSQDRQKAGNFALAVILGHPLFQEDLPIIMERMVKKIEGADCNILITKEGFLDALEILPGRSTYMMSVIDTMLQVGHWKDRLTNKEYETVSDRVTEMDIKKVTFSIVDMRIHISSLPDVMAAMAEKKLISPEACSEYVTYEHHGEMMVTRHVMKGHHRDYCLCYDCDRFIPDDLNNCHKAQMVYDNCVALGVVTPVWECADFVENAEGLELVTMLGDAMMAAAEEAAAEEERVA